MDAKLKTLWLEALRSGQYPQTRGTLQDAHGYCCLGVLCKVALDNDLLPPFVEIRAIKGESSIAKMEIRIIEPSLEYNVASYDTNSLPTTLVQEWNMGTAYSRSAPPVDDLAHICTIWNDADKLSFHDIANKLEKLEF